MATAARSGVVDVDVDVALALVGADRAVLDEGWLDREDDDRPLRWLREDRLARMAAVNHQPRPGDPRCLPWKRSIESTVWRRALIDRAIRRISAGLRDWGPLMARSRSGQRDLIAFGDLRVDLLHIERALAADDREVPTSRLSDTQQKCRRLAWRFETTSAPYVRAEILQPADPQR